MALIDPPLAADYNAVNFSPACFDLHGKSTEG